MKRLALAGVSFYQRAVSPWSPGVCRYEPTCSEFGRTVIERHGVMRGGVLTLRRLLRCTPLHSGGYDPPPP